MQFKKRLNKNYLSKMNLLQAFSNEPSCVASDHVIVFSYRWRVPERTMATNLRTIFGKARQSINDAAMTAGSKLKAG